MVSRIVVYWYDLANFVCQLTRIGVVVMILGNVLEISAFSLAAQSVIAPLGGWSIVYHCCDIAISLIAVR